MALIKCHECGAEISTEATACPRCGAKPKLIIPRNPRKVTLLFKVTLFFVVILFVFFWVKNKTDSKPEALTATESIPAPEEKKAPPVDFSLPLVTESHALVCPIDVVIDEREARNLKVALDANPLLDQFGCHELNEGLSIILSEDGKKEASKAQSNGLCMMVSFLRSDADELIFSCDLKNYVRPTKIDHSGNLMYEGANMHCNLLTGTLALIPMWKSNNVPFFRIEKNVDDAIINDLPITDSTLTPLEFGEINHLTRVGTPQEISDQNNNFIKELKSDAITWRSSVASTPSDMDEWNAAITAIYNSTLTGDQIEEPLRKKYCTDPTTHVLRASDLNALLATDSGNGNQSTSEPTP